jgi:carboxyl-terminal processing protease
MNADSIRRRFRATFRVPWIVVFLFAFGCENDEDPKISPAAKNYLDNLVDIMRLNSINRKTIDWASFRSDVFAAAGAAQSISETSAAQKQALVMLHDNHSFIVTADNQYITSGQISCTDAPVTNGVIPENIGYVKVGGFSGSASQAEAFAQAIQNDVRAKDKANLKGWIVDLRGNTGGNMWPMIAGVGPILGTGVCGHFIDPDDRVNAWQYYSDGTSRIDGQIVTKVASPYTVLNPNPKVAVLLDKLTTSSGEATAIAFIGRNNTRSFGRATCSLSTANASFNLTNGSKLYLTVAVMADRSQKAYGSSIVPDEVTNTNGEALLKAIDWLNQ